MAEKQFLVDIGLEYGSGLTSFGDHVGDLIRLDVNEIMRTDFQFDVESLYHDANKGIVDIMNMPVTSASPVTTEHGYAIKLDDTELLRMSGESDGAGGIQEAEIRASVDFYLTSVPLQSTQATKILSLENNQVSYRTPSDILGDIGLGSFTEGYIPFGDTDGTLTEDSGLFWDNTGKSFEVGGDIEITDATKAFMFDGQQFGRLALGTDAVYTNTYVGGGAGSGTGRQSAFGYRAGYANSGANQSAFGYIAGRSNTGDYQSAFGSYAGYLNSGIYQSAFGYYSGYQNSGTYQSVFGYYAGRGNTGDYQSAFGYTAGYQNSGA